MEGLNPPFTKGAGSVRFLALVLLMILAAYAPTAAQASDFSSSRIGVETTGSGPDVVLIPGFNSHPEVWQSTVAAIPGYRYHLVHVSGFAGRPAGGNMRGPVLGPVADEIARYIRDERLDRPALIGHSLGGTLALMIAARHPELVARIMVVDIVPFVGVMFDPPGATADSLRPIARQLGQEWVTKTGDLRRRYIEQATNNMIRTTSFRPRTIELALASDPRVQSQAMYELITTDLRPELVNIRVPLVVLFVHGPNLPYTLAQVRQYYLQSYANTPQAVITWVPDSYHFIMFDQPATFQREVRAFLGGA